MGNTLRRFTALRNSKYPKQSADCNPVLVIEQWNYFICILPLELWGQYEVRLFNKSPTQWKLEQEYFGSLGECIAHINHIY